MPRGFAKFSLIAYVSAAPEEKEFASGSKRTNLRLGVPRPQKDSKETVWESLTVTFWGDWPALAYLEPGRQVYVEGRLSPRTYQDEQGQKRYALDLVAQDIVLLGNGGAGKAKETTVIATASEPDWGNDMPF
jgi:single-strand DNA-binding protein